MEKKKSWVNLNYTSGEEEMHMETDHNLDVNASCQRGTRGRARPPQITKHELTLRLPADKSCSWVGKHLTWTTGPDLPSVRSAPLSVPRSALPLLLPLPERQRQRDKQNLELTQNESSACTKATLILLNSSAWSTAASPLINSGNPSAISPYRSRSECMSSFACALYFGIDPVVCTCMAAYVWPKLRVAYSTNCNVLHHHTDH